MTFQELKIRLVKLGQEWDENLISDQEFDSLAAQAAMAWARKVRRDLLGQTSEEISR